MEVEIDSLAFFLANRAKLSKMSGFFLTLIFVKDYVCDATEEKLIKEFREIEWEKYPILRGIRLTKNSIFLAQHIPPKVSYVELDVDKLHDVCVVSDDIIELSVMLSSMKGFDPLFFERLPISIEILSIKILVFRKDTSVDSIFTYGFHNLPPSLKCFGIIFTSHLYAHQEREEIFFHDKGLETVDYKKCFTVGPSFKTLTVNGENIDFSL